MNRRHQVFQRENLAGYNEECGKYFPTNKPARTTVTVASLNAPELLIEITVTACISNWLPGARRVNPARTGALA